MTTSLPHSKASIGSMLDPSLINKLSSFVPVPVRTSSKPSIVYVPGGATKEKECVPEPTKHLVAINGIGTMHIPRDFYCKKFGDYMFLRAELDGTPGSKAMNFYPTSAHVRATHITKAAHSVDVPLQKVFEYNGVWDEIKKYLDDGLPTYNIMTLNGVAFRVNFRRPEFVHPRAEEVKTKPVHREDVPVRQAKPDVPVTEVVHEVSPSAKKDARRSPAPKLVYPTLEEVQRLPFPKKVNGRYPEGVVSLTVCRVQTVLSLSFESASKIFQGYNIKSRVFPDGTLTVVQSLKDDGNPQTLKFHTGCCLLYVRGVNAILPQFAPKLRPWTRRKSATTVTLGYVIEKIDGGFKLNLLRPDFYTSNKSRAGGKKSGRPGKRTVKERVSQGLSRGTELPFPSPKVVVESTDRTAAWEHAFKEAERYAPAIPDPFAVMGNTRPKAVKKDAKVKSATTPTPPTVHPRVSTQVHTPARATSYGDGWEEYTGVKPKRGYTGDPTVTVRRNGIFNFSACAARLLCLGTKPTGVRLLYNHSKNMAGFLIEDASPSHTSRIRPTKHTGYVFSAAAFVKEFVDFGDKLSRVYDLNFEEEGKVTIDLNRPVETNRTIAGRECIK